MGARQDVAQCALRHARQKAYRDLERESKVGEIKILLKTSPIPNVSDIDGLECEINEFTSSSGREKSWTDLSVDDRIAKIGEALGSSVSLKLQFPRFMIYRHSSEILHGTLFGAMFILGLTRPADARGSKDLKEYLTGQHMLILMAATGAVSAIVQAFHHRYKYPKLQEVSVGLWERIMSDPYLHHNESDQ